MGTRTLVASRGSSTATSSTKVDNGCADGLSSMLAPARSPLSSNRHKTIPYLPPPLELRSKSLDPGSIDQVAEIRSSYATADCSNSVHTLSPTTPNFSVPTFSKRYSSFASPGAPSTLPGSGPDELETVPPGGEDEPSRSLGPLSTGQMAREIDWLRVPSQPVDDCLGKSIALGGDISTTAGQRFPRRFSSLEYSRGVPPSLSSRETSSPPHPPPITSLPAIPASPHEQQSSRCDPSIIPRTLRRPASMQVGSTPLVHHSKIEPTIVHAANMTYGNDNAQKLNNEGGGAGRGQFGGGAIGGA